MSDYQLWTLTAIGEMDRCIVRDLDDREDAAEQAQKQADDRDVPILLMRDREGIEVFYPDYQP